MLEAMVFVVIVVAFATICDVSGDRRRREERAEADLHARWEAEYRADPERWGLPKDYGKNA